jgi:hypothetical protein
MTVWVFEGTAIHEALIFDGAGLAASSGGGAAMDGVHCVLAVKGQAQERAALGFGIDYLFVGKAGLERTVEQHDVDGVGPCHGAGLLI